MITFVFVLQITLITSDGVKVFNGANEYGAKYQCVDVMRHLIRTLPTDRLHYRCVRVARRMQ